MSESLQARAIRIKALNKERNKLENRIRYFELVVLNKGKKNQRFAIRYHDNYAAPLAPVVVDLITTDPEESELHNTAYIHNTMRMIVDKLNS